MTGAENEEYKKITAKSIQLTQIDQHPSHPKEPTTAKHPLRRKNQRLHQSNPQKLKSIQVIKK